MWKKFKQTFNKEFLNYSTGYVDPLEFHSMVYFLSKSFGLLEEFVPSWSRFLHLFMVCCPIPAIIICTFGLYHGWEIMDVAFIIEAGTYIIVLSYELEILSCIKLNIHDFHILIRVLKADFEYACTDGSRYRERFFENQLHTWKICIMIVIAILVLCLGMAAIIILTLMYYLLTHDSGSEGQRPLFFPFWAFDVNFNKSPNYEITFVYSEICVLCYGYNYIFMITTQILWIREIATKADLVIWGIQDLMDDIHPATNDMEAELFSKIIKHRMRAIIQQHHSMYDLMENYSRVYKKLLMFEQTFCGPVVCLTAYSAAEKFDDGEVNYILIILGVCAVTVSVVPSYLCTILRSKVSSVFNACWDTPFWNARPVICPYLVLIMQRSLRPLPLNFAGFQEVSLQTFANKMTSAYSCFNMLRQAFK